MKNKTWLISWIFLWASVAMTSLPANSSDPVVENKNTSITKVDKILINKETYAFEAIIERELSKIDNISSDKKEEIKMILSDKKLKETILKALKEDKENDLSYYILALISALIYFYLYYENYKVVKAWHQTKSLTYFGFALSSAISLYLTGVDLSNIILLESVVFWTLIATTNYFNIKTWKTVTSIWVNEALNLNPISASRYDENWRPIFFNKIFEKITWVTLSKAQEYYDEIIEKEWYDWQKYYEKRWEILTLFYKWYELEKAKKHLEQVKITWIWYEWITFTMNNLLHSPTFSWTTFPDIENKKWTIRYWLPITDINEIQEKLQETEKILSITQKTLEILKEESNLDQLTQAFNRKAFNEDMQKILRHNKRQNPWKIMLCYIDVDNFRKFNEKFWHEWWDKALKKLSKVIMSQLRETDKLYRVWWDEFILVLHFNEIDDISQIYKRLNLLRWNSSKKEENDVIDWVWTSWWIVLLDLKTLNGTKKLEDCKKQSDEYMYCVKDLGMIKNILLNRWIREEQIPQKNAIAYPIYNENNDILWINIVSDTWTIFISKEEFETLKWIKTYMLIVSDIEKIKDYLLQLWFSPEQIPGKDVSVVPNPSYNDNGEFIWINIKCSLWDIFIDKLKLESIKQLLENKES